MRSSFAIASIIIGICAFIQLFGAEKAILAIIFGILALKEVREKELNGKYLAIAGIILGIIYIILLIAVLPSIMRILPKI
ncbi:DUF4190 domain-containing protein [Methanothermobacter tenebrarum]|uniref:DUF4190 domain-containing protein n=1 Tax=Methanothermobacter tenebrarum TaxID=680118 RepID=A0A328PBA1_9EURY|nr:DUF4190 domain-containing protein [Methanothermobacter tenebrarum]MBC7100612.1 DUF4190 domain-containing protein [Methanobacteriales archaeon]MBC7118380.1 DUF4190 domain-containing protein [Methanobacteriaceae archaeon]HPU37237.1 DUF4190 domain-containing protein [Methanothermobacter sp.]NPV65295.1 DUF4190 domain-containing protein [Methanobacteriaceae archaeon]RAO79649.1 hypothetical protein DPC56_02480 [Methanothermobacter tenebrarum]